ncbi:MAG: hypothetical protein HUU20_25835 [Pirellulales bacterium]|nr:hypothetical protein [Pirellulales bacterium]
MPATLRRGAALLVCIFVMAMTAAVVVAVVDSMTLEMTALRHTTNYERASYLAGAAVYHALAELEADTAWRAGVPNTEFPVGSGNSYLATVVDGAAGTVVVTGNGTAGGVTRKLELTVELGG